MVMHRSRIGPRGGWLAASTIAVGLALSAGAAHAAPAISALNTGQSSLGSYVVIYGSDFGNQQGQSYVMYGGHFVPVVAWSNNAITAYLSPTGMTMSPGTAPSLVVIRQPGNETSNPFSPCRTTSDAPDPEHATTGKPQAIASR